MSSSVLELPPCCQTRISVVSKPVVLGRPNCLPPCQVSDSDYLGLGFRIIESTSESDQYGLKISLGNLPCRGDVRLLLRALTYKMAGRRKRLSLELSDRLTELARSWHHLHDLRYEYQDLFRDVYSLEDEVATLGGKVRWFHENLVHFAGSSEPRQMIKALFRVHEVLVLLRKFSGEEEWPLYAAVNSIWWFLDEAEVNSA